VEDSRLSFLWPPPALIACTVGGSNIIVHTYREGDESIFVLASDGTCHDQATTGPFPPGISMCAATALAHETLVLFDGYDKNQAMRDTVYTLSTKTWRWRKLVSSGKTMPTARSSECMVSVDDRSTCLVFVPFFLQSPYIFLGGSDDHRYPYFAKRSLAFARASHSKYSLIASWKRNAASSWSDISSSRNSP
jgi:hypothetical protein